MAIRYAMIAALTLGLAACDKGTTTDGALNAATAKTDDSLTEALGNADGLDQAAALVKTAGLEKVFDGQGSYTLFAPTDAAIAELPADQRKVLESAEGRAQLIALLSQHVAPGYITREDLDRGLAAGNEVTVATIGPAPVVLKRVGDAIMLGDGDAAPRITGAPILARNGTIYPIDHVLPAPTAE